ncbi:uncharacterized protein B0H18DRAFT_1124547 [Fomitopsis serialis]|uniref:uncharacterized protein n=1 Tax=Fomitopsis serialis TaxID=139415 RepID=UPI0020081327|nr:uncharacterized protein B0H18DRAFT_1124547 [Neoantrodia serialis]KAH9916005.1 hypothetical protein B0H18DRAFT_1124547 [Neoantrodia serialis]
MSYGGAVLCIVRLMCVEHEGRWADLSFRNLTAASLFALKVHEGTAAVATQPKTVYFVTGQGYGHGHGYLQQLARSVQLPRGLSLRYTVRPDTARRHRARSIRGHAPQGLGPERRCLRWALFGKYSAVLAIRSIAGTVPYRGIVAQRAVAAAVASVEDVPFKAIEDLSGGRTPLQNEILGVLQLPLEELGPALSAGFAAVLEIGREIDGLDGRPELAHRVMLTSANLLPAPEQLRGYDFTKPSFNQEIQLSHDLGAGYAKYGYGSKCDIWETEGGRWYGTLKRGCFGVTTAIIVGACAIALQSVEIACDTLLSSKTKVMLARCCDGFSEEDLYEALWAMMEVHGFKVHALMSAMTALELGCRNRGIVAFMSSSIDKAGRSVPAPDRATLAIGRGIQPKHPAPILDIAYRSRQLTFRRR